MAQKDFFIGLYVEYMAQWNGFTISYFVESLLGAIFVAGNSSQDFLSFFKQSIF